MPVNQGAERRALEAIFHAAVSAVEPGALIRRHLVSRAGETRIVSKSGGALARVPERAWLVAAGKAAPAMARTAAAILRGRLCGGVVAAPTKTRGLPPKVESFAAGHPLPDRGSHAAGRAAWRLLGRARRGDLVLVLLSGGASSLLVLPAAGITLRDKIRTNRLLLDSGAPIGEINAVRKHLSKLKGGGLAKRAAAARVVTLLLSDVIGSSPAVIGSGPTAADSTTFADAWRILARHSLLERLPAGARRRLRRGRRGRLAETPKPGSLHARHLIAGDNRLALRAAADAARALGLVVRVVTHSLRGDTRRAAESFAAAVRSAARGRRPICLLAGGETTVRVRAGGKGGRNQEFALHLADSLSGLAGVACLSAGSDGIDGPTDAAGAFVDATTSMRAARIGLDADRFLARHDSYRFFALLGDLFRPGPTGTNVMDLKIAVINCPMPHVSKREPAC